jgi:MFS transporter, DHA1 family, tetracycline resistance protein
MIPSSRGLHRVKNRRPLAVIFLTVFVDLLGFGILIPILPIYATRFGATALAVGLLSTTYSVMQLLFAPLWGRLSDRIGRKPVIVGTALGAAVAYVVFGIAGELWILFLARAIGGACGANISTAQAYIADVTPPEQRARGMAIIGAGFGLGFTFGPALAGLGTHFWGVRAPFFIAAGLALLNALLAATILPEPERHQPSTPPGSRLRSLGDAFRVPRLAFFMGIFFLVTYAFAQIEATFALWTHAELGFEEKQNGWMFTYIGLVLTLVQVGATRRLTARFGEVPLVIAGCAVLGVGALLLPGTGAWWVLLGPVTCLAVGNALYSPSLMATLSKAAPPDRQGEMLGIAQSVGALGRIVGPATGGLLFDVAGHSWPFLTTGVLMLLAAALVSARGRPGRDTSKAR